MRQKIGLWLDRKRAVLVTVRDQTFSSETIELEVPPPAHSGGGLRAAPGQSAHGVGPDDRQDARLSHYLDRFYDAIIARLGDAEQIHILGPGQAKHELKRKIASHKALASRPLSLENADRLTDPQIVARVREVFGVPARRAVRG
ncbi:MAG TPA: hypothetical protein PLL30_09310 [Candidatus Krumholzibacteria bacterium]|nr:hypothetical protein [Candidatus Krumholzibacteria bacterium]HPD71959.1 hypothetical protein [Candidatus Krumholzibacteria bacterium]HRY41108.1 hypothetical protein [Candidatus Krumholzibacteria bacterium]